LRRDSHGHDLHIDFAQPIRDWHDHGQSGAACLIKNPPEPEDQATLVLLHYAETHCCGCEGGSAQYRNQV
jgi:hypothetical protein